MFIRATDLMRDSYWYTTKLRLRDFSGEIESDDDDMLISGVITTGSAVRREFGFEQLQITPESVGLSRLRGAGIPLLNSHRVDDVANALGRLVRADARDGVLHGTFAFNKTEVGRAAFDMVRRGEVGGISPGYKVEAWEIRDSQGRVVNPELEYDKWSDSDLTFLATRFELLEVSLCTVPQDGDAVIGDRAFPVAPPDAHYDLRERMATRHRMMLRAAGLPSKGVMPGHALSHHRSPTIFGDDRLVRYGDDSDLRRIELPPSITFTDPPGGR